MRTTTFVLVLSCFSLKALAAGGGKPQQSEFEALKAQLEESCRESERSERELQERASGPALEKAIEHQERAAVEGMKAALEGSHDYARGDKIGAFEAYVNEAKEIIGAHGEALEAAADVADAQFDNSELSKQLGKAQEQLEKCKSEVKAIENAVDKIKQGQSRSLILTVQAVDKVNERAAANLPTTNTKVAQVIERRAQQKQEQERRAQEARAKADFDRANRDASKGFNKEFDRNHDGKVESGRDFPDKVDIRGGGRKAA